jgi:hypothetical protein
MLIMGDDPDRADRFAAVNNLCLAIVQTPFGV